MTRNRAFGNLRYRWKLPWVVPLVVATLGVDFHSLCRVDRFNYMRAPKAAQFGNPYVIYKEFLRRWKRVKSFNGKRLFKMSSQPWRICSVQKNPISFAKPATFSKYLCAGKVGFINLNISFVCVSRLRYYTHPVSFSNKFEFFSSTGAGMR